MSEVDTFGREFLFGGFQFLPGQQLLLERGKPVKVGTRALGLLHALVERPGEVVGRSELIASVWPDTSVADSNLKVQVATLRRVLGDGRSGTRYVATANGRGYRFVAPVELSRAATGTPEQPPATHPSVAAPNNLSLSVGRPLGRDRVIDSLLRDLPARRFVTIVGPGGIGKTTVALFVANGLLARYPDGVWLVELATLRDPHLVPSTIAAVLGMAAEACARPLASTLRDKAMLLVLDCCEHLAGAAALISEEIVRRAPGVHVLATSREPLRARGETVQRLGPLATPLAGQSLTAVEALRFPAVQLFVDRAGESHHRFVLDDGNVSAVVEICRQLDGMALAIELAARRSDAFAPPELLTLLQDRFRILTCGRRTDLPRHQTLSAAIDWSHDLLPENERAILRRVSIFAGSFTLPAALTVVSAVGLPAGDIAAGLGDLVTKSLVSAEPRGHEFCYRLLDTTRAYARAKLVDAGEATTVSRQHALLQLAELALAAVNGVEAPGCPLPGYVQVSDDVRAALDWAFSDDGDAELGAALTAASIPLWTHLSHVDECRRHMERALDAAWDRSRDGGRIEMRISAAFGSALLQTQGPASRARKVWQVAARTAGRLGEADYLLQALWGLCDDHTWRGEHRAALNLATRIQEIAVATADTAAQVSVRRRIGTALRYIGELPGARSELELMLGQDVDQNRWMHFAGFHLCPAIAARGTLSNVLWLQGLPEEATSLSRQMLAEARDTNHVLALCNAFAYSAIPITLYTGDLQASERLIAEFRALTDRHRLPIWNAVGRCLNGIQLVQQNDPAGVVALRTAIDELDGCGFRMRFPAYLGTLASALAQFGQLGEAKTILDRAFEWSDRHEERWCHGELLRIKGELLHAEAGDQNLDHIEELFSTSLGWSSAHGIPFFGARATASLEAFRRERGSLSRVSRTTGSSSERRAKFRANVASDKNATQIIAVLA